MVKSDGFKSDGLSESEIITEIASHYKAILQLIGEDVSRQGLVKTPERAAKALWYVTRGYRQNITDVVNGALFENSGSSCIVVVRDIEFYSLCEHHILPFFGHMDIGYIPGENIIGLSKVARIVDMFSRRLQVQEHLTEEVADALMDCIGAQGVIVRTRAHHLCMEMRGVGKQDSTTVTLATRGVFATDRSLREEFFSLVR